MEPLNLANTKKEWAFIIVGLVLLILVHLSYLFVKYQEIIQEEVYYDKFIVKNIYPKANFTVLKLSNDDITYFTSVSGEHNITQLDSVELFFNTQNLSFYGYLQGFYKPSFGINVIESSHYQLPFANFIESQHTNQSIADIYKALFIAIPLPREIVIQNANFGVSHLFAISGFHLGILLGFIYFILHLIYTPIHRRKYPYRNKRFDILILSSLIIFAYLVYIDMVASFLRSFVMFVIGIIMLRSNIKLLSFNTLFITLLLIIALFPKLLFSLSLWFSIIGVFYIFLFLHYFKDMNKYVQFILFNIFIFTSMNPVVHYFFSTTSYEQMFSPIFTIAFTIFYPISLILHLFNLGNLLDFILDFYLNYRVHSWEIETPFWMFLGFILLSLGSIWNKTIFYIFIVLMTGFNIYLFLF